MLHGFVVTFTTSDDKKREYNFLWANTIIDNINFWCSCVDVIEIKVVNMNTGELMFCCNNDPIKSDYYVCPDWQVFEAFM